MYSPYSSKVHYDSNPYTAHADYLLNRYYDDCSIYIVFGSLFVSYTNMDYHFNESQINFLNTIFAVGFDFNSLTSSQKDAFTTLFMYLLDALYINGSVYSSLILLPLYIEGQNSSDFLSYDIVYLD